MSKSSKRSDSFKRKHWSIKAHESLICRNQEGHFCLNVEGGAEVGLYPYVGEIRQDRIRYQSGKLHYGELILEVNGKRVPGMIKKDVIALIKRSADPVSLVTVKQNATITKDIRQYLGTRFTKNSVDSELQHQIRENLHMRVVPCTTRSPQNGERQGVDYDFVSVEAFKLMEKNGDLLESGVYESNYYGTPKPPADPPSSTSFPAYSRSPASSGYSKEGLLPSDSLSPSTIPQGATGHTAGATGGSVAPPPQIIPKNPGPLPANWEIAYTENNEKYFIDHNTGTTHWLDPRFARYQKHSILECSENELPYGWEKVNDPVYGVYFIDHINRTTQYENPVVDAKRRFVGSQLPQRGYGSDDRAPPPMREPPSMQSAAALEKQREAEAAAMWPNAGLSNYDNYPYPNAQMNDQDLEAELQGNIERVSLKKTTSGFGFTIIGGDRPGELLQIKSIVRGSVAERDGRLQVGDVLVRINGISVLTYSHKKVVDLFQNLPLDSDVMIEIRRGYPLPELRADELPTYNDSNWSYAKQNSVPFANSYGPAPPEKLVVSIIKGPLGFGFSLGESAMGPVVKQIMDHPRCAQLREGDIILEVNGEKVNNYVHSDLVTVLKRCGKGNQANFTVLRQPAEYSYQDGYMPDHPPHYSGPGGYQTGSPQHQKMGGEPFTVLEIRLMRQVSGFGFRIIGGKEEGSQATVGAIVEGGAADLDGRLIVGDEITHINGFSVMDASHREVISLMGEAAAQGEVVLGIRRKMPLPESVPPLHGPPQQQETSGFVPPHGVREVTVERPNIQTSFGFVLQSNTLRPGCMICRLVPDSPAELCNQLYVYDELLAVNGQDVSQVDHGDIVTLIKSSGTSIHLTVQQPEDVPGLEGQQMDQAPGMQQTTPMGNHTGWMQQNSIPQQGYREERGRDYPDYPEYSHQQYEEEAGPQISANLSDIASDDEEIHHIDIQRDGQGFGFSIRGGAEYNAPLCVLRMAEGGAAERDGRLKVGDELLEINGNNTEGMLHSDAITIIKHGGNVVKLIVRRGEPFIGSGNFQEHKSPPLPSPPAGSYAPADLVSPTASATKDRYAQDYMNSLNKRRSPGDQGFRSSVSPPPNQ